MTKQKQWKPTCAWVKKERAASNRALRGYQAVQSQQDPVWRTPFNSNAKYARVLYLYAAAMGQKLGLLPQDLGGWSASGYPFEGEAKVMFGKPGSAKAVTVMVRNLDAWPAPAVEETEAPEVMVPKEAAPMPAYLALNQAQPERFLFIKVAA